MRWSESFATGIERIDDQHKMLFKMAEDFGIALDEGRGERVYGSLLQSLDLYARTHFRFEEGCMDRCHCPVGKSNQQAHTGFITLLARYHQRYEATGFDRTDARDLTDTIDRWLSDHIGRIDVQLRESADRL